MVPALLGADQVGQGEVRPGDSVLEAFVIGVLGKQGVELGNCRAALVRRLCVLAKNFVDGCDSPGRSRR